MDSFEINKVLGAILGTCLVLLSVNIAASALFATHAPDKPGYKIAVTEQPAGGEKAAPTAQDKPLPERLASADMARGETSAKKCISCHTFDKGGRKLVGPNLGGIGGRAKASVAGLKLSAGNKGKGGNWTLEDLDVYLLNPKAMVPGTNMSFAGIPRGTERADLLSFLNSKSDNPAPLPKAADAGSAPTQQASAPKP